MHKQHYLVYLIIFVTIFCLLDFLFAQEPAILWTKTFGGSSGDWSYDIQQTNDGGYIIVGYTNSFGIGNNDLLLIKTNSQGDSLWLKTFGGINDDEGRSVQQTSDGGYIIVGNTKSFGAGNWDLWLIKTDANGNALWGKTYGGIKEDYAFSVQQTTDGGYIIIGATRSFGDPYWYNFWLLKADDSGDTLWTRIYQFSRQVHEVGRYVRQTGDGGYILVGYISTTYRDIKLAKTDSNGNLVWSKTYGGIKEDYAFSVQQTNDGGYVVLGTTSSLGNGNQDFWLLKTDTNGDTLWTKTFGGTGYDFGYSVKQVSDNGYVLIGKTGSFSNYDDIWLIRTDMNGDILWSKTFGGSGVERGYSIQQTADYGYIISGVTDSFGAGDFDVWVIKLAPDITSLYNKQHTFIKNYNLQQNYPNPFNPITHIRFGLPKAADVLLEVYNTLGQKIATLAKARFSAGYHEVTFEAGNLPSGIYLLYFKANDYMQTRKMILMK